mgnify:FL=1
MNEKIYIEYPESLAKSLKLSDKEFTSKIKTSSLVKLYEMGEISSGLAAKILGISRLAFLELLAQYKVSIFQGYDSEDIDEDIVNA